LSALTCLGLPALTLAPSSPLPTETSQQVTGRVLVRKGERERYFFDKEERELGKGEGTGEETGWI
jgi:hypothetical protein